jgi:tRNA-Thr(GGU) m(6)t(6)A37 methyltransferase TsaA
MDQQDRPTSGPTPPTIQMSPIGVVRNNSRDASWGDKLGAMTWEDRAATMREQRESVSEVVIDTDVAEGLEGIDEFSHVMVLYWPHLLPEERRFRLKVHPMGNSDFPLVGVFATHSPARPNPVLISVVRLLGREGNVLRVTGLDALDGSPVLDIKPYLRERAMGDVRTPDWMGRMRRGFAEGDTEAR